MKYREGYRQRNLVIIRKKPMERQIKRRDREGGEDKHTDQKKRNKGSLRNGNKQRENKRKEGERER